MSSRIRSYTAISDAIPRAKNTSRLPSNPRYTCQGIDVLAAHLGAGEAVSAWTSKAMDGNVKFEDALAARLDIIKPSKSDIEDCLEKHPFEFTPGLENLVKALHEKNVDVWLVSGGVSTTRLDPIPSYPSGPYANAHF